MDLVTSAQYQSLKDSLRRKGTEIEAEYTPAGDIDYMYAVDTVLALDRAGNVGRLQGVVPGLSVVDGSKVGDVVRLSTTGAQDKGARLNVPEVMRRLQAGLGTRARRAADRMPLFSPDYVVHITKICPAGEPEVPSGYPKTPWPPVASGEQGKGVQLLVVDTGLVKLDNKWTWLKGVKGDPDALGSLLPTGQYHIPQYSGHGTFVAGTARCMAPAAEVFVGDHFTESGGEVESAIIAKLEDLVQKLKPNIVCLPAGTYTRENWGSLSFSEFHRRHPDIVLVASAGNDSTARPFYPAAFDWVVGVGALSTDQQHRAWFSNFGASADVYALGEGTVNAYPTGLYTYQEPPKRPAQQSFTGMARWDGTSYSAPLVAGLIAAEMSTSKTSAETAKATVLGRAQALSGVGSALVLPL